MRLNELRIKPKESLGILFLDLYIFFLNFLKEMSIAYI